MLKAKRNASTTTPSPRALRAAAAIYYYLAHEHNCRLHYEDEQADESGEFASRREHIYDMALIIENARATFP